MPLVKICPKCGLDYALSEEYCTMLHCPFCGDAVRERGIIEIITPWLILIFYSLFVLLNWFIINPPTILYDFVGFGLSLLILGGVCYYFSNPKARYQCYRCRKMVASAVTGIPLVEPSIQCPKCGFEMPVLARFCGRCGTKID